MTLGSKTNLVAPLQFFSEYFGNRLRVLFRHSPLFIHLFIHSCVTGTVYCNQFTEPLHNPLKKETGHGA